jgi:hypothetical protein
MLPTEKKEKDDMTQQNEQKTKPLNQSKQTQIHFMSNQPKLKV